ncbi:MAG TPA: antitoxin Xre-like helix-turn-helix domain-containing protein [Candidatus Cybelea sp.]
MSQSELSPAKRAAPRGVVRELLRQSQPSDDVIIESVGRGLLPSALDDLLDAGLSDDEVAGVIGFSVRTLHRKRDRRVRLGVAEGDRAVRLARALADADRYIGARGRALRWLRAPNWSMGGRKPLDLLATEPGTELVRQALVRIAYGGVA